MALAPASAVDTRIRVPILRPRSWQREVLIAREQGIRRLVVVVHRRAGKTVLGLTLLILGMLQRPGVYSYQAPFYNMGRKILWDGRDHLGRPFLDHFPPALVRAKNETEMQIELATAHGASSIFQVLGADQPDRLRGVNPFGVVLDEFSIMDTAHPWDLLRPILAENAGWAAFLYTPAGRNHGHELYEQARQRADWFTTVRTTEDTRRDGPGEDGGPIISAAQIEEEIRAGMPRALANQEFGCSFVAAAPGAYFSKELEEAQRAGRIRNVPWDPRLGVTTAWDLGISDAMAIVFAQTTGIEVRIIDYLEDTGQSLAYYAKRLAEKSYRYQEHILPHDAEQRELGTGKTRLETLRAMSLGALRVLPNLPITDGIEQARQLLARAYIDQDRCRPLLKSLEHYRTDWLESRKTFALRPRHDWASAGADAVRYLALGLRTTTLRPRPRVSVPPVSYSFTTPARRVGGSGPGSERL